MSNGNFDGVQHDRGHPMGSSTGRGKNRNAIRAMLEERGFTGVTVSMHTRDYALIDLSDVPEKRQEVAEAFFESSDAYHREPEVDGFEWGVTI